jgi:hypothetical protein
LGPIPNPQSPIPNPQIFINNESVIILIKLNVVFSMYTLKYDIYH